MENKKKILLMKPINDVYYVISPNLGLGFLARTLIDEGHIVDIIDSGKEKLTYNKFKNMLLKKKYDLIGFQTFTHEMASVKKHAEIIKKINPLTIIIVGGPQPSGDPEGTMKYLDKVDFGFIGECELALPKFANLSHNDLKLRKNLKKIPNLVWRDHDNILINSIKVIDDLDKIKSPVWALINPRDYPVAPHGTFTRDYPVAPIIITRGCPYNCSFCAGFKITGKKLRVRSLFNVMEEIRELYFKYGVREFHIEDDNFTLNKEIVKNFCLEIIKSNLKIAWSCPNGVRLDTLDKELISVMELSGCYSIAVGIESGSERILKLMKKSLTKSKIKEKIDLIKDNSGIKITGFFLIGDPHEDESDILKTIKFSKELKIDKAAFAFMMPLPGTEIWNEWIKSERGKNFSYENFFYYRTVPLSEISEKKLRRLYKKAFFGFYLRPRIIFGVLSEIKTLTQIKSIFNRLMAILTK